MSDLLLFAHPMFGVLGILASVWVFVEVLNASAANAGRIRVAAGVVAVCIVMSWILGGYWYVHFYAPEKAIILKGPMPSAHTFFMETKEHLFFIPLILALYLPFAARAQLVGNAMARSLVLVVAFLIVGTSLSIEAGGAAISYGVKVAFVHPGLKGAE
jgi:hypothetical protein